MSISNVDLNEMLEARERRCRIQNELLSTYQKPLVCLTMNIAGPVKRTPLIELLFRYGLTLFESNGFSILTKRVWDASTGCEAFYSVDCEPDLLKATVCAIEDRFPAARLFDFDVIDPNGVKLSRSESRKCLVCGGPVLECSRSRAHGLDRIMEVTGSLLDDFAAGYYADCSVEALIREVHATPKPGLVDENNCGAHSDMNLALFETSANALRPYFRRAVLHGLNAESMSELRKAGIEAERTMFEVTGGVNTHKGAIFSFGLMLSAIGTALRTEKNVYERISELLDSEVPVSSSTFSTHGDQVRNRYGMIGALTEAKAGFPSARYAAERLEYYRSRSVTDPDAFVLCDLMSMVEDTNVYHRGGSEGAAFVRREALRISKLPFSERTAELEKLDKLLIEKNLSPGGCADLLALSYLIECWNADSEELFD